MKKAIITGSTGLVGAAVTRLLSSLDIQLLCLGRKNLSSEQVTKLFGGDVLYISLPMSEISSLPHQARNMGWGLEEDSIFFNFAWSGVKGLTDGGCGDQLANAIASAEAVKVAKSMRCSKFINSGSMEESFIEDYLNRGQIGAYQSSQVYYGLSKLAARNMCTMIAYLEGIDYVHTRMSVPLAPDLSKGNYISATLKRIFKGEEYEMPSSEALYDIVSLDDVARAYHLIGLKGHNKANYFIGTGAPQSLRHYFDQFSRLCGGKQLESAKQLTNLNSPLFDTLPLKQDVGFVASQSVDKIFSILRQL
jgi:nucleoside-diphosphate-sugar epimerase